VPFLSGALFIYNMYNKKRNNKKRKNDIVKEGIR